MTDYAATIDGRARLVEVAVMQLEAKRQSMGRQDGDDVELWKRERQLEDVLNVRWIEIQDEIERTSKLIGQVATLEGKLRDMQDRLAKASDEIRILRVEKQRRER